MLWIFLTWLSCCPCSLFLLLIIIESPLAYKVAWSSNNRMLAFWEVAIFLMTICNLRWHVLSKDLVHFFWDARLMSMKLFIGFCFYCHRICNDHIYLCLIMVAYLIPLAGGLSVLLICFLRCIFWFYWFFLISFQFQFSLVSAFLKFPPSHLLSAYSARKTCCLYDSSSHFSANIQSWIFLRVTLASSHILISCVHFH